MNQAKLQESSVSVCLSGVSAKEGEAANREPRGGAEGGKTSTPGTLTCSQVLRTPPGSSIPLLLLLPQLAQPVRVRTPQKAYFLTLSG